MSEQNIQIPVNSDRVIAEYQKRLSDANHDNIMMKAALEEALSDNHRLREEAAARAAEMSLPLPGVAPTRLKGEKQN
jgi:hypothetical protein